MEIPVFVVAKPSPGKNPAESLKQRLVESWFRIRERTSQPPFTVKAGETEGVVAVSVIPDAKRLPAYERWQESPGYQQIITDHSG